MAIERVDELSSSEMISREPILRSGILVTRSYIECLRTET